MILIPHYEFTVEAYLQGVRIDSFLIKHLRNYSPFRMQRLICAGAATIDNNPARLEHRVFAGQQIAIKLLEPPDKLIAPEPVELRIVYEDAWLLAINKPAPMTVHPVGTTQSETLCNAVQHHLDQQTKFKGLLRPGIVHRLDRMTSGLILLSKEHLAHRNLSIQFQKGTVEKEYLTIVEGNVTPKSGRINFPIGNRPEKNTILMSAKSNAVRPKSATTLYQVLNTAKHHTLLEAKPLTGRLHQIRVHLAEIGHPVVGDDFYAVEEAATSNTSIFITNSTTTPHPTCLSSPPPCLLAAGRHALHCHRMSFKHPITNCELTLEAPCPLDFSLAWKTLNSKG